MHPQVERAARCCRCSDSGMHAWCGHATVMVLVSSASGTNVSGCIARRALRTTNFGCRACRLQMPDRHTSKFVSKKKVDFFTFIAYNPSLLC